MIPALFDVGHSVYVKGGGVDDFGNPVAESWSAPVVKKFITLKSQYSSEPKLAGHDRDVVEVEMLVYPGFGTVRARDRMSVDGQKYEVIGAPEDFTKSPFEGPMSLAHFVINLKAVNG